MKGHLRQRSKGSWTLWVDLGRDLETGKRKQQLLTVRGNKKDAERELRAVLTRTGGSPKNCLRALGAQLGGDNARHLFSCPSRSARGSSTPV